MHMQPTTLRSNATVQNARSHLKANADAMHWWVQAKTRMRTLTNTCMVTCMPRTYMHMDTVYRKRVRG